MYHRTIPKHGKVKARAVERHQLRTEFRNPVHEPGYEFFLGLFPDVRCPEGIDLAMPVIAVGHQSTDANNGVVDVLGEFISHCLANLMVGLAVVSIGGGKASQVRDRFNVPNDEMVRHLRSSKLMVSKILAEKLAGDAK
jgi:hypothetical protein